MSTRCFLGALDAPTRMFLVSLCLTDGDLQRLGVLPEDPGCCVSPATRGRGVLQHLLAEDRALAESVTALLDLRFTDTVAAVMASDAGTLHADHRRLSREAVGDELAAWAWATLRDPRAEVQHLGRSLMGEAYVRGMASLARR